MILISILPIGQVNLVRRNRYSLFFPSVHMDKDLNHSTAAFFQFYPFWQIIRKLEGMADGAGCSTNVNLIQRNHIQFIQIFFCPNDRNGFGSACDFP